MGYILIMMATKKKPNFAINLKRIRKKRGLSQYDLADLTGISQRMIAHYETHVTEASLKKIEALAKALKVNPSDLLDLQQSEEIDVAMFDTRSLKKLKDILSLPQNDRAIIYRMLNKMLRERKLS